MAEGQARQGFRGALAAAKAKPSIVAVLDGTLQPRGNFIWPGRGCGSRTEPAASYASEPLAGLWKMPEQRNGSSSWAPIEEVSPRCGRVNVWSDLLRALRASDSFGSSRCLSYYRACRCTCPLLET